jgi:hypothetical protein
VKGVIDLHGKVIPVVDLRLRFGMEEMEYTDRTCIIVVEISANTGTVQIGIVVDSVSEVLNIKGEDIEDTPTSRIKLNTEYIFGIAKMEGGVEIMIDIDKVLSQQELELVSAMKKEDSSVEAEAPPEKAVSEEIPPEKTVVEKAPTEKAVELEVQPKKKVAEEAPSEKAVKAEVPPKKKVAEEVPPEKVVEAEAPPEKAHMKSKGARDNRKEKSRKTTKGKEKSRKTKSSRGQSKREESRDKATSDIDIEKYKLSMKVLHFLSTPVMAVDKEFNIIFMNPTGAQTVGKTPEACVGQKCYYLFNTEHCNTPNCQVAKAMQQDGIFTSEIKAKLASGELPIRYTGAPLKNEKGNIVGGLELAFDISKEMEVTEGVMNLERSG